MLLTHRIGHRLPASGLAVSSLVSSSASFAELHSRYARITRAPHAQSKLCKPLNSSKPPRGRPSETLLAPYSSINRTPRTATLAETLLRIAVPGSSCRGNGVACASPAERLCDCRLLAALYAYSYSEPLTICRLFGSASSLGAKRTLYARSVGRPLETGSAQTLTLCFVHQTPVTSTAFCAASLPRCAFSQAAIQAQSRLS